MGTGAVAKAVEFDLLCWLQVCWCPIGREFAHRPRAFAGGFLWRVRSTLFLYSGCGCGSRLGVRGLKSLFFQASGIQNSHQTYAITSQFHLSFDPVCGEFAVSIADFALGNQLCFDSAPDLWSLAHGLDHQHVGHVAARRAGIKQID